MIGRKVEYILFVALQVYAVTFLSYFFSGFYCRRIITKKTAVACKVKNAYEMQNLNA